MKWPHLCSLFHFISHYSMAKKSKKTKNLTYLKSVSFPLVSRLFYMPWPLSKRLSYSISCVMSPSIKHYFLEVSLSISLPLSQLNLISIPEYFSVCCILFQSENLKLCDVIIQSFFSYPSIDGNFWELGSYLSYSSLFFLHVT